ncbi:DUF5333 family protein [Rhodobaculum claviforme]|uniref:DUF5333 family protein n=1 Tax=Rhodobaculum claviforme TaxID=1549854 RepID=UPI001A915246
MAALRPVLLALGLGLAVSAPAAGAEPAPLREDAHIDGRLLAAAIGDEIRRNCPTISERRWVVRAEALKLYNRAIALGHTRRSIEAYLDDPEARAAMERRRDAWLAANGVVAGDADSYCRAGLREIDQGSYLGSLMRVD